MMREFRKAPEKIVFLNDKNLEQLKGYKAYVQVSREGEIHITVTGLNTASAKAFFDKLEALNPREIISDST
jgi:hypothetical protein